MYQRASRQGKLNKDGELRKINGQELAREELKEAFLRRAEPVLEKKLAWCVGRVARALSDGRDQRWYDGRDHGRSSVPG